MAAPSHTTDSGPVRESGRITSLDLIRGIAVLGILLMNAVNFGLGSAPYFNLSAAPSQTPIDWAIGILGEVFVDQKFMGLFSLLFGAGMILFIDRAEGKGMRAVLLNLWRNALLLVIGILHMVLWDGDILIAYALSSVFLLALRKLPNRALISLGVAVFTLSVGCALIAQNITDTTDVSLSGFWTPGEIPEDEIIVLPFLLGYFLRALGADSRRRRPVSRRLHERRPAREDVSTYRGCRACRRPAACRLRRHHYRSERLLSRDSLYRSDSQHAWLDSRLAGIHEPHHPLEQPRGQLAQEASARSRGGWRSPTT